MNYFTSDLHLGHKVIAKYRPQFKSAREHDNHIIDMILALGKRDILFILGDFLFDGDHYEEYVERLKKKKCRIKLIMGNHDSLKLYKEDWIEMQLPLFSYKNHWITHCPIHPQEIRNRAGCIHGHLHGDVIKAGPYTNDKRYFNVNLDNNDFKFVTMEQITAKLKG